MTQVGARSPLDSLRLAAADIKLAHSVFALPFALLAAVLAIDPAASSTALAGQIALVILCMVLARTWAMLFNRLADRSFDAANPRTARRAVASGLLPVRRAWTLALTSALLFILTCSIFLLAFSNPWPLALSLPTLAFIAFYSLTKRFTALCHLVLGAALAFSPIAAAIALRPSALADTPAIWLLAGMVLPWVAGFDVIYALQDLDFDRSAGLRSMPARLGVQRSIWVSRLLHLLALAALTLAWWVEPRFGPTFLIAVALVAILLLGEHLVLARRGSAGIPMAFFTYNGLVSCVVGLLGILDATL